MGRVGDQDGHEGRCRPREKLGIAAKMGKKKEKKAYRETDNSRDPDVQPSDPRGPRPAALPAVLPPANTTSKRAGSVLQKMREKLQGGHFRWINEQLYTTAGDDALTLMNQSPELYAQYHEGFRKQTENWPLRPVDSAIKWLRSRPKEWRVADLGCGDAELAGAVKQKIHSFDLLSIAPGVISCNMADLPLDDNSIEAAIFCLSLMGTDYGSFIEEAARVVISTGWIWIAEVQSRFIDDKGCSVLSQFVDAVTELDFVLVRQDVSNSHFLVLEFQGQAGRGKRAMAAAWPPLRACQYKKR